MALQFGAATALTGSWTNLGSGVARSSAAVTTDTTKNITGIMLEVSVLTTSTAPSGNKQVVVYGYKSTDGTNYQGGSATSDTIDTAGGGTNLVIGSPSNLTYLGTVQLNQGANAITLRGEFEITGPFGCIPPKWGIVLYNDAGTALGGTVTAQYREIYYT